MQLREADRRLPSFLVIGAIKAATTWISDHLRQSPAVFMPASEPHYFTREFRRGLGWYENLFAAAGASQIIGEKTADYLANPDAPRRACELLPHAALIVSLRNPIERAYSDYCMLFRRGTVSREIENYLDPGRAEFRRFLDNGLYHKHISAWLDHYPKDEMLVLLMEDITNDPDGSLRAIAGRIGLEEKLVPLAQKRRVNSSRELFLPLEVRKVLSPFKTFAAPVRGTTAFQAIRGTLARPIDYPKLTSDLEKRLQDFYHDDLERLEKLLKRDLRHWSQADTKMTA